jgi:hypothetical protein
MCSSGDWLMGKYPESETYRDTELLDPRLACSARRRSWRKLCPYSAAGRSPENQPPPQSAWLIGIRNIILQEIMSLKKHQICAAESNLTDGILTLVGKCIDGGHSFTPLQIHASDCLRSVHPDWLIRQSSKMSILNHTSEIWECGCPPY